MRMLMSLWSDSINEVREMIVLFIPAFICVIVMVVLWMSPLVRK
jgi:hypothetical protein